MWGYVVNLVGRSIHITSAAVAGADIELVAVGLHLDVNTARRRLEHALEPAGTARAAGSRGCSITVGSASRPSRIERHDPARG
jgi:hypothetical protein